MVYTESVILTSILDAKEGRDVATIDIPNAFAQTIITDAQKDYRVIARIQGKLVDILVDIALDIRAVCP